ncbi:hypothetical protein Agub_g11227 [Astrephomene gubernaculifera]|uniref:Exocyst complex component Sec6 n=1 Tax=Astrephomene gubernaculifera TaxID=47775 RepID=A0AAD3DWM6_9CHLO|nr:hypothetical protein Agub_g11227 [Astrephomene gubernaculifera]
MADAVDLAEQALQAKEQGINEILRLLQRPEDLSRLADITAEYESRHRSAKATLSAMVQSQVESIRQGMDLLERARRHITKLQAALDKIDKLCSECADLVHHHDKIKLLSTTHGNIKKVLSEIEDIVDLPYRADRCWELLQADEGALVPAFEALLLLTGTAENAKQAWQRGNKSAAEVSELRTYLARVDEVMARFESRLFDSLLSLPGLVECARERPALLVDCVRVVELQELVDSEYRRVKMGAVPQRRYKERLFAGLTAGAEARFQALLQQARDCNKPNKTIKYDQNGDVILSEVRDYLGGLSRLVRVVGGREEVVADPEELRGVEVIEEEVFDEDSYLDELLNGLYDVTDELAAVYDYVSPCFPPSYDIFNRLFQAYHVQLAAVVDVLGHGAAEEMSTRGALRVMDWVQKYMDTLRNLGVDEDLIRLPPSPLADPDSLPGMVVLMESYVGRMEGTVTAWYRNILAADLQSEPKQAPDGTLCTLGAVDFFRILNQQIAIIEALNDHGEVMFQTARTALRVMRGFQEAAAGKDATGKEAAAAAAGKESAGAGLDKVSRGNPGAGGAASGVLRPLSLEMAIAFLNNNVTCYDQSLAFAEDVQRQLERRYREQLDVEEVCRGFLEVAKTAAQRAVELLLNDPGMSTQIKGMYGTANTEYLSGRVTATLLATLRDYFSDLRSWVAPPFLKRVAEAALEELVRRAVNMFAVAPPQESSESLLKRMSADESELAGFFEPYLKADRLRRHLGALADMRELLAAGSPEEFSLAYSQLAAAHPAFTLEVVSKLLTGGARPDLTKKQIADITAQCKEIWKQRGDKEEEGGGWGFFGWGKK